MRYFRSRGQRQPGWLEASTSSLRVRIGRSHMACLHPPQLSLALLNGCKYRGMGSAWGLLPLLCIGCKAKEGGERAAAGLKAVRCAPAATAPTASSACCGRPACIQVRQGYVDELRDCAGAETAPCRPANHSATVERARRRHRPRRFSWGCPPPACIAEELGSTGSRLEGLEMRQRAC